MSDDCRLCHCCNDAPDRHGEIMSELAAALEQAKADKMAFVDAAAKELATANLQKDQMERRLSQAVNSRCSCGGMGPGACGCDYCALYHFVMGNEVKRVEPSPLCSRCKTERAVKAGCCQHCYDHLGD